MAELSYSSRNVWAIAAILGGFKGHLTGEPVNRGQPARWYQAITGTAPATEILRSGISDNHDYLLLTYFKPTLVMLKFKLKPIRSLRLASSLRSSTKLRDLVFSLRRFPLDVVYTCLFCCCCAAAAALLRCACALTRPHRVWTLCLAPRTTKCWWSEA